MIVVARSWATEGDRIVADIAHVLNTPIPAVRQMPIGLVIRMHAQARRIVAASPR